LNDLIILIAVPLLILSVSAGLAYWVYLLRKKAATDWRQLEPRVRRLVWLQRWCLVGVVLALAGGVILHKWFFVWIAAVAFVVYLVASRILHIANRKRSTDENDSLTSR
jgi:ACR3 family arsenite efflux pump ArsB